MVVGPFLCLLSAAGFGAMAIFGKLAYDNGVTVGDLLLVRFAVAAVVMLAIVPRWCSSRSSRRRRRSSIVKQRYRVTLMNRRRC